MSKFKPKQQTEGWKDFWKLDPPSPIPPPETPEHTKQGQYMCTYCMGSGCFKCNYNGWTEAVEKIVSKLLEGAEDEFKRGEKGKRRK